MSRFVAAVPGPEEPLPQSGSTATDWPRCSYPPLVPIPLPLKVFVISAGVLFTPLRRFTLVLLPARVVRYFGLAWLGVMLGKDANNFLRANAGVLAGVAVLLFIGMYALLKVSERRRTA